MTYQLKLEANEIETLQLLSTKLWAGIFANGGQLMLVTQENGFYSVPLLGIDAGEKIVLTGRSMDICEDEELFRLEIWNGRELDDQHIRKMIRPSFEPVTKFPVGLDLTPFLNCQNKIKLLRCAEETTKGTIVIDTGILVTNSTGKLLLIQADKDFPLNVRITLDEVLIKGSLETMAAIDDI